VAARIVTMMLTRTLRRVAAYSLVFFMASAVATFAQQPQPTPPTSAPQPDQAATPSDATYSGTGAVKTTEGGAIPGAAVKFTETTTNKSWASWTDQAGKYDFPALPAGHYRVEVSQLGFVAASLEVDMPASSNASIDLVLRVATLAELSGGSTPAPQNAPAAGNRRPRGGAGAQPDAGGSANGAGGGGQKGRNGGRGGQAPAGVLNAVSGGFQQTNLTGEAGGQADENPATSNAGT
jgi:hypothetical protein